MDNCECRGEVGCGWLKWGEEDGVKWVGEGRVHGEMYEGNGFWDAGIIY